MSAIARLLGALQTAAPSGGAVAGILAATEAGSDTASASGDVFVQGTAAATETGPDTFAAAGDVFVSGALSAAETGADTAAIAGDVVVAGALSASEVGQDAATAAGVVVVQGALSASEAGDDVFASSGGQSAITGDLTAVESGSDVAYFVQEQQPEPQRHAGGRRGYIFKGKRYWLNQHELAQLIHEEQARIEDVQRLKRNKPKTISAENAKAIEAIIASLNLPVEVNETQIIAYDDDDEALELLLTL